MRPGLCGVHEQRGGYSGDEHICGCGLEAWTVLACCPGARAEGLSLYELSSRLAAFTRCSSRSSIIRC